MTGSDVFAAKSGKESRESIIANSAVQPGDFYVHSMHQKPLSTVEGSTVYIHTYNRT